MRSATNVVNRTGRAANNPVDKVGLGERLACVPRPAARPVRRPRLDPPSSRATWNTRMNSSCHAGLVFVAGALLSGKGLLNARRLNGA